jgi:CheR methyltransferase-like protein
VADPQDDQFDDLLELLKRTRGFDFSGYKRTTLARRVAHRMQALEIENYGDYVDHLELHPEEYTGARDHQRGAAVHAPLRADDKHVVGVILVMDPIEQKVDDSSEAG